MVVLRCVSSSISLVQTPTGPNLDPEPLSFVSLGEGAEQHSMGKVYSGLYECAGYVVPYLVLVKIGKLERSRPGNRGKRDSQMLLMHFVNKVRLFYPQTRFFFINYFTGSL
jgi:chitin synthase